MDLVEACRDIEKLNLLASPLDLVEACRDIEKLNLLASPLSSLEVQKINSMLVHNRCDVKWGTFG
jgi:hypothetical protein